MARPRNQHTNRRVQSPLVDLFASESSFSTLPAVLPHCSQLEKLSLAACGLQGELAGEIGRMGALRWVT